jgi:transposase
MLTPELQAEILALHYGQKKGTRAISKELSVNRKTVRHVIQRRTVALEPEAFKRSSILDVYKPQILELLKLDPKISGAVVLQRIREEGYMGGPTVLQEWLRKQRVASYRPREAFLSLKFNPGECAQVDWGEFGDVFGDGIKVHCFLMVLCYSRLLYIEFTRSEKFEEFIRCHENAFRYFGGVPQECWYDNLRSAVTDRLGRLVHFNARFMAYMGHHGIKPHACNPARGNEKGRVESAVKYVRSSFWPGRKFSNFDDLTNQASVWCNQVANKREHGVTRKVPVLHFESDEKNFLRPLNPHPYDTCEVFSRVVPPTFHIIYDTNKYSVPWTLVGMTVTVKSDEAEIKIFYNERFVAKHPRSYKKHQTLSQADHVKGLLERKPGATRETWQTSAVKSIGPKMNDYVDLLRSGKRSLRAEISKILALATVYGAPLVNEVAGELLSVGIMGVENMELSLKSRSHPSVTELFPAPLNFRNSKLNRVVPTVDLRRFDALLFKSTAIKDASQELGEENESRINPHRPEESTN